jgi:hypothetical protein
MFVACNFPSQTMTPCCRPFPLAMADNALNLRRSPELENHYKFLTDKRTIRITRAATIDLTMACTRSKLAD